MTIVLAARGLTLLSVAVACAVLGCSSGSSDGGGGSTASGGSAASDGAAGAGGVNGSRGGSVVAGASGSAGAGSGGASTSGASGSGSSGNGGVNESGGAGVGGGAGPGDASAAGGSSGSGVGGARVDAASVETGASAGPCSAPGLIFCDDFEQRAAGQKPTGAPWLASTCSATGLTLKVDPTIAHTGMQALVSQGVPYGACMLHADIGVVNDFWVRSWVLFAKGDAAQFSAHEVTAFEITPTTDTDDPGIRVGFRGDSSCIPTGVELNITGGEEKTGCTGTQLQADRWTCFELHVTTAPGGTTAELFVDSVDQHYNIHGTPAETVVNPQPTAWRYLRLGTRSYSNAYPSLVYVDDVAAGTQRIGCN
jgi:hypothetical protein